MSARYVSKGCAVDYIPSSDVTAGTIVVQGALIGVAAHNIAANELGAIDVEGIYIVEKNSDTDTFSVGDVVYLNSTQKAVTTDASAGTFGVCISASVSGDTGVRAKLCQCIFASGDSSSGT